MIKFSIKQLFNYNLHLGFYKNKWNPRCAPYIFGTRNNISILNLEKSFYMLKRSFYFLSDVIRNRGVVLLINLRLGNYVFNFNFIKKYGQFSIINKYTGGLLTNFKNVKSKYKSLNLLHRIPNVVFVGNLTNCDQLVLECKRLNIPLIGVVDSNINPEYFSYPIAGNSSSLVTNRFYYSLIFKSIFNGILQQRYYYKQLK